MPPIRSRNLPRYANRAGDPCFPPPYVVDDAGMDIFICEGDPAALTRMINRALNLPTARQYGGPHGLQFELASPMVGFACIDVRYLRSKPAAGQLTKPLPEGITGVYAHQTEVAVMVQVRDEVGLPYWYLPYVLNDLPTAVTTGREIYGYPKQHAMFIPGMPVRATQDAAPLFGPQRNWNTIDVWAYDLKLPPSSSDAEFAPTPVLTFRRGRPLAAPLRGAKRRRVKATPSPDDFALYPGPCVPEAATPRRHRIPPGGATAVGSVENIGRDFLQRIKQDIPYAFLRQFREPARESLASYQALVIGRLVPSSDDMLRVDDPSGFTLAMPWAFNLALAQEVFAIDQPITQPGVHPPTAEVEVLGLLSGKGATFDVLRAAVLWQFGLGNRTNARSLQEFQKWRAEVLAERTPPPAPEAASGS